MNNYFWLVTRIPDDKPNERDIQRLEELRDCHLSGIRGISNRKEILSNFFGVARNAAIFMKADRILPYNDLHPVPYDDPDELLSNDMSFLARLYEKRGKYARSQIMLNILQTMTGIAKSSDLMFSEWLRYNPNTLPDIYQNDNTEINNVSDLTDFIIKHYPDIDHQILTDIVRKTIKRIGDIYSDEGERVLESPNLVYPIGQIMLVGIDPNIMELLPEYRNDPDNFKWMSRQYSLENHKNLMDNIEKYRLDKRYSIRYIDKHKFEAMRETIWGKRKK